MRQDDPFDTIIQAVTDGYGREAAPARAHRVLWFAVGTALWLTCAILLYVLGWFVLHG